MAFGLHISSGIGCGILMAIFFMTMKPHGMKPDIPFLIIDAIMFWNVWKHFLITPDSPP